MKEFRTKFLYLGEIKTSGLLLKTFKISTEKQLERFGTINKTTIKMTSKSGETSAIAGTYMVNGECVHNNNLKKIDPSP